MAAAWEEQFRKPERAWEALEKILAHQRSARADAADARAPVPAGAALGRAGRDAAPPHQRGQRSGDAHRSLRADGPGLRGGAAATSIARSRPTTTSSSFDGDNNARARRARRACTRRSRTGIAPSTTASHLVELTDDRAHARRAVPAHRPHLRGAAARSGHRRGDATAEALALDPAYVPAMQSLTDAVLRSAATGSRPRR